ncbi:MAG: TraB/GumN family protein, partial [Granulosicoccaceae bacterium]
MTLRVIAALGLLLSASLAQADGPVWKVSSGDRVLYLGGTIHVLGKADYPLPSAFEHAYDKAATIVFETDLRQLQNPAFQRDMLVHLMYPDGQTIDQY